MNIVAIIQARTGSTRLPNKIFNELAGKPLVWHVCERLKYSKRITKIVIATTNNIQDDILESWAKENKINYFRGSENDVLSRYYYAALEYEADIIVRITADDPFKDPDVIDMTIRLLTDNNLDFAYNNSPTSFPEGLDVEVFTQPALETAFLNAKTDFEKEHVTQFFYKNIEKFNNANLLHNENLSHYRWTIDTNTDYLMAREVYENLYKENEIFKLNDILDLLKRYPEIAEINASELRSAMYNKK